MRRATLTRTETTDQGTFGTLVTDTGFTCRTGELPWRDNHSDFSCIPPGEYFCSYHYSPSHGLCYWVGAVPNRQDIQIHSANFCGDKTKGFKSELLGCIAPGLDVGILASQKAVIHSREALIALETNLNCENLMLKILGVG